MKPFLCNCTTENLVSHVPLRPSSDELSDKENEKRKKKDSLLKVNTGQDQERNGGHKTHPFGSAPDSRNRITFVRDVYISIESLHGLIAEDSTKCNTRRGLTMIKTSDWRQNTRIRKHDNSKPVIKAVVSFFRRKPGEEIPSATHVESFPCGDPLLTSGKCNLYVFQWSRNSELFIKKVRFYCSASHDEIRSQATPLYSSHPLDFFVSLVRGNEFITLGKATLVLSGGEFKMQQLSLSIKDEKDKWREIRGHETQKPATMKKIDTVQNTFSEEAGDRKYRLDYEAKLKVAIKILPSIQYKGYYIN